MKNLSLIEFLRSVVLQMRNPNVIVVDQTPLHDTRREIQAVSAYVPNAQQTAVLCYRLVGDMLQIQIAANGSEIDSVEVKLWGNLNKMRTQERRGLLNPEALRERLAAYPNVIIADGELQVDFTEIFADKLVMRTYDLNSARIQQNLNALQGVRLTPQNTAILEALPTMQEEIKTLGLTGTPEAWQQVKKDLQETAEAFGYNVQEASREAIAGALGTIETVIIFAHCNMEGLFLRDGTCISAADLSKHAAAIRNNRPLVLLFASETARIIESESFAKGLLQLGVKGVIAPTGEIDVRRSLKVFEWLLELSRDYYPLLDGIWRISEQIESSDMELWLS